MSKPIRFPSTLQKSNGNLLSLPQAYVPDAAGLVQRTEARRPLRGGDGHRARGREALPVRVPPELLARRWQGRSAGAGPSLRPPGLALHRRAAAQTGRYFREGQTYQQRDGQVGTRECKLTFFIINYLCSWRLSAFNCCKKVSVIVALIYVV